MLANNKIHWNDEKHLEFTDKVYEKINYYAIKASMNIAKAKGEYSCFRGSDWDNGDYFKLRDIIQNSGLSYKKILRSMV